MPDLNGAESDKASARLDEAIAAAIQATEALEEGSVVTSWFVYGEGVKYNEDGEPVTSTFRFVSNNEMSDSTMAGLLHMAQMEHDDELTRRMRRDGDD